MNSEVTASARLPKPIKSTGSHVEQANKVFGLMKNNSRDCMSTIQDDQMCRIINSAWPAIDQALLQLQRDMSKATADDGGNKRMNELFHVFSQIHNKLLEYADIGAEQNEKLT